MNYEKVNTKSREQQVLCAGLVHPSLLSKFVGSILEIYFHRFPRHVSMFPTYSFGTHTQRTASRASDTGGPFLSLYLALGEGGSSSYIKEFNQK